MRPVYAVSGGVSKFAKARPDKTFPALVKEAYDYALDDLGLTHRQFLEIVDGSVASYFSDHFARQLMAAIMAQGLPWPMSEAKSPSRRRRRYRRNLFPGSVEGHRFRLHGCLPGLWL